MVRVDSAHFMASPIGKKLENDSVVIREYNEERHKVAVEEMEKRYEIGEQEKPSLVTDLLGDPICRIRHFSSYSMLVAEYGEDREIVGIIRACIKRITREHSYNAKLAYILGLRVSPSHWRLGIGTKLVQRIEEWCRRQGADYAYMATDCTNQPSINLFTNKCSYTKFRTLTMLVQPVHAHKKPIESDITIFQLNPRLAEAIYRRIFSKSEFFPDDIDTILSNNLNLGTYIAVPKNCISKWDIKRGHIPCNSFAILSVWNTKEVFKLQVKGMSKLKQTFCMLSRLVDAWMPWLRVPSIPNVFRKFGIYFLYGLHMEGEAGPRLMRALCSWAHNLARNDDGCGAIVAEVGQMDPLREVIPHWTMFSWAEDLWCIKKLNELDGHGEKGCGSSDWINSQPSTPVIFVDPRDF